MHHLQDLAFIVFYSAVVVVVDFALKIAIGSGRKSQREAERQNKKCVPCANETIFTSIDSDDDDDGDGGNTDNDYANKEMERRKRKKNGTN